MDACETARAAILNDANRLNAELDQRIRELTRGGIGATYRQPKQVSAVCSPLGDKWNGASHELDRSAGQPPTVKGADDDQNREVK
jgi:hypothetical protein